jgi:anti-anti-sigma factor
MTDFDVQTSTDRLPIRSGYIVDGRVARWRVQVRRQALVLTVCEQIDASNTDHFSQDLRRLTAVGDVLVVDLTAVDFFGVQGLRVLVARHDDRRRIGQLWVLVAGRAVRPLSVWATSPRCFARARSSMCRRSLRTLRI